jgi:hypothetical protein
VHNLHINDNQNENKINTKDKEKPKFQALFITDVFYQMWVWIWLLGPFILGMPSHCVALSYT